MHQFPRSPPVTASPAQSPRTNPTRTNNSREHNEQVRPGSSGRVTPSMAAEEYAGANVSMSPEVARLNQTIQNLFCKSILVIVQNRLQLTQALNPKTGAPRISKWFSLDIPESDTLKQDYQTWRHLNITAVQPPTMIIDVMISSKDLKSNETLVYHDEYGKTRYVDDIVRSYYGSKAIEYTDYDIVLERWSFSLENFETEFPANLANILPKMYKNAVVLFRALFSMLHLLPAWPLSPGAEVSDHSRFIPKLNYRVYDRGEYQYGAEKEGIYIPFVDSSTAELELYDFEPLDTPAGQFRAKILYRRECDFRIERSEATISSRMDDSELFKPSLRRQSSEYEAPSRHLMPPPAPPSKSSRQILRDVEQAQQAYGSLSTYHLAGYPLSSSPLSTLRAARELNASPRDSPTPPKQLPEHRGGRDTHGSYREGPPPTTRRTSVTFQPFKSPSLSASPSPLSGEHMPTPRMPVAAGARSSALTALAEARNPGLAQQNQFSTTVPVSIPTPAAASPRPKYSSSFSHRRSRNSVSLSKDDDLSSGRGSPRPGSGTGEGGTSSGSLHADDDNISDFLKMLDSKKDLKSFRPPTESGTAEASTRRTTAALSKFSRLRDSAAVLSESMSSSVLGHRSSTSSSRQLSSVPPMVGGNSLSSASSPGERMSPRTPHTPAIPSRLSANSIIDYTHRERSPRTVVPEDQETAEDSQATRGQRTGAIDIPSSPRVYQPGYRRSSSVAQQQRALAFDEDLADALPFGHRSTSLGGNGDREPLSLSRMLALQDESAVVEPSNPAVPESEPMSRQRSTSSQDEPAYGLGAIRGAYRSRGLGRGQLGPHGSSTSLAGDRGSASGGSDSRGGRYSFQRTRDQDDEELLFAMSDFGVAQQGRRSLEEARRADAPGSSSSRGHR